MMRIGGDVVTGLVIQGSRHIVTGGILNRGHVVSGMLRIGHGRNVVSGGVLDGGDVVSRRILYGCDVRRYFGMSGRGVRMATTIGGVAVTTTIGGVAVTATIGGVAMAASRVRAGGVGGVGMTAHLGSVLTAVLHIWRNTSVISVTIVHGCYIMSLSIRHGSGSVSGVHRIRYRGYEMSWMLRVRHCRDRLRVMSGVGGDIMTGLRIVCSWDMSTVSIGDTGDILAWMLRIGHGTDVVSAVLDGSGGVAG
jgi:hypothetical protein